MYYGQHCGLVTFLEQGRLHHAEPQKYKRYSYKKRHSYKIKEKHSIFIRLLKDHIDSCVEKVTKLHIWSPKPLLFVRRLFH